MFNGRSLLITGGTGSFGRAFVKYVLTNFNPERLVIFSRDEMKQWSMASLFGSDNRVRFFVGDVRDKDRLYRAFAGVDYVVHAAATKIVPIAEYNPFECIKTNINGAVNVIDAAMDRNVKAVVALSTDKACSPVNLYGATKLASDKLFVAANSYSGGAGPIFSVVRYGNVMGSRGSVIPFFNTIPDGEPFPITHPDMTRFMIDMKDAIKLVMLAMKDSIGGEIFVKKIPSMKVTDIAKAFNPDVDFRVIGIRPGEKLHEQMISIEDAQTTYEYGGYYKILPTLNDWHSDPNRIKNGVLVSEDFSYSSNSNSEWMSTTMLKRWILENQSLLVEGY